MILALMLVRASVAMASGDMETLKAVCGVKSVNEEAEEEAATGIRMVKGESA
jgi:hypothetical protein